MNRTGRHNSALLHTLLARTTELGESFVAQTVLAVCLRQTAAELALERLPKLIRRLTSNFCDNTLGHDADQVNAPGEDDDVAE